MASRQAFRGRTSRPQHGTSSGVGPTAQGTLGGTANGRAAVGARPGGIPLNVGDEAYLWILVALEVLAIAWGRRFFRRFHGG